MTEPWLLTDAKDALPDRTCCICGGAITLPAILALPHWYHRACHERFHKALWEAANAGKTVDVIRKLVAEDVQKGRQ